MTATGSGMTATEPGMTATEPGMTGMVVIARAQPAAVHAFMDCHGEVTTPVSYTHLTLPTKRIV